MSGTAGVYKSYPVVVLLVKDGSFVATTGVRGAVSQADTEEKAIAELREKLACMVEFIGKAGHPFSIASSFPEPRSEKAKANLQEVIASMADLTIVSQKDAGVVDVTLPSAVEVSSVDS
jgi:predicted RNase H-like HicB family nuclease